METARICFAGDGGEYFASFLRDCRPAGVRLTIGSAAGTGAGRIRPDVADCIVFDATSGTVGEIPALKEMVLQHSDAAFVVLVPDHDTKTSERALIVGAQVHLSRSAVSSDSLLSAVFAAMDGKRRERAILQRAFRDDATGLSSRLYFMERLVSAFERSDRTGNAFGVVFLSICGFERIVKLYGHEIGDGLVRQVSGRLKECGRGSDTLSRMDIDEFVVLIEDLPQDGRESGAAAIERLARKVGGGPYDICGLRIDLEIRTGMALYPLMGHTPEELLTLAGRAMHEPKHSFQVHFLH